MTMTTKGSYARDAFHTWHVLAADSLDELLALMDDLRVEDIDTPFVKFAVSPQDAERQYKEMSK